MRHERPQRGRTRQSGILAVATAPGLEVAPSHGQRKPGIGGGNSANAACDTRDETDFEDAVRSTYHAPTDPNDPCTYRDNGVVKQSLDTCDPPDFGTTTCAACGGSNEPDKSPGRELRSQRRLRVQRTVSQMEEPR